MRRLLGATAVLAAVLLPASAGARVLLVGSFHGIKGQFTSIQAAVKAAKPDDWILVGPGDYKEHAGLTPKSRTDLPSGVLMQMAGVYLRGMNRNTVIVDGTKPGSPVCSNKASDQEFGPHGKGLNGIMVWKATDVWVQNLTACNYLHGSGDTGNEIWWNGGDNSGKIGGKGYLGSYLTTTSTFFKDEQTAAQYGIFSSNWNGGTWDQTYASNFNDSGYYIGACQQQCNQTVDRAHGEFNALGYSGSNSGGTLIVKNSVFDNNEDGFDTNSQNGDNPPPQNGACPGNRISPITHTHSCWVFMDNYVHDNNNPNVPSAGAAAAGPVGTGMTLSGGRNDTVMHNRFVNNHAWGVAMQPYTDSGTSCPGGTVNSPITGNGTCLWDDYGDALLNNSFSRDGGYGNPTNGDFEQLNLESHPSDCFRGNTDTSGHLNADAAKLQASTPTCSTSPVSANANLPFLNEVLCDSGIQLTGFGCQPGDHYPTRTKVVMHPLPKGLPTMPNPCDGVPADPWCVAGKPV